MLWLIPRLVLPSLFSCQWPCSVWSVGRSRLRCCLVDDFVLFGPLVGLASIVLLSMTVLWLIDRSVSPSLFTCRWPCSDWSVGRSRIHCSIAHDHFLICPSVGLVSVVLLCMTVFWLVRRSVSHPLFYCRWPCSCSSVRRSRLHWSLVEGRFLIGP